MDDKLQEKLAKKRLEHKLKRKAQNIPRPTKVKNPKIAEHMVMMYDKWITKGHSVSNLYTFGRAQARRIKLGRV